MKITKFKAKARKLTGRLDDLIECLPNKGNKCSDSQKICLKQALKEFEATINGTMPEDLISDKF